MGCCDGIDTIAFQPPEDARNDVEARPWRWRQQWHPTALMPNWAGASFNFALGFRRCCSKTETPRYVAHGLHLASNVNNDRRGIIASNNLLFPITGPETCEDAILH